MRKKKDKEEEEGEKEEKDEKKLYCYYGNGIKILFGFYSAVSSNIHR